jgi:outer membrane protein assembly factor BamA
MKYLLLTLTAVVTIFALPSIAESQQDPAAKPIHLATVQFSGLERYKQEQILVLAGLQIGQTIDPVSLDAASNKLISSGLFKKITYLYSTKDDQMSVTFQAEEMKWNVPVVFDNFIWFSDKEITDAVRREVPYFDGNAPDAGGVTDTIKRVLEQLVSERHLAAQVEYLAEADKSGKNPRHIFSVKGVKIPVCAVHFPGASAIREGDLLKSAGPLLEGDYSRSYILSAVTLNLLPLYRARGYLRAGFGQPSVTPLSVNKCQNGVDLSLPLTEGSLYSWNGGEWSGNTVFSSEELNASLGMKPGEIAAETKLGLGLAKARDGYAKKGYVASRFNIAMRFDDANRQVVFQFNIEEGQQYRMGSLIINGLSDKEAGKLKSAWKLSPGMVYDASYLREFDKKLSSVVKKPRNGMDQRLNRQDLTVDILISFAAR